MNQFEAFLEELEIAAACEVCGEVSFEILLGKPCPDCREE